MPEVIFKRTYRLYEAYEGTKERAHSLLGKYLEYPGLIEFKDSNRSVTFSSERLIPAASTKKPRVMLLFSNPHPNSVQQGMFHAPAAKGGGGLFWPVMESAGWLPIPKQDRTPEKLADICLNLKYEGSFEFIFYCYYAFPTDYPEDIRKIFGKEYFQQFIEPEAKQEFRKTIQETPVDAVVTFNKGIFNLVSRDPVKKYIDRLIEGDLIRSQVAGIDMDIPIFLTFPTGYIYHKDFMELRKASLDTIRTAICEGLKGPVNKKP